MTGSAKDVRKLKYNGRLQIMSAEVENAARERCHDAEGCGEVVGVCHLQWTSKWNLKGLLW